MANTQHKICARRSLQYSRIAMRSCHYHRIRDDKYSLAHCALVCSTYSVIDIEYTTDGTDFKQFVDVLIYTPFSYQNLSPVTINLSNSRDKNNKLGSICIAQIDKITIKKQIDKEVFFDHFGITEYVINEKSIISSIQKLSHTNIANILNKMRLVEYNHLISTNDNIHSAALAAVFKIR